MPEKDNSGEACEMASISELEQYLDKSVKPYLMPSTFVILKSEFRKREKNSANAQLLLDELIEFFSKFNPGVGSKLRVLHDGLFLLPTLPPPAGNTAANPASNRVVMDTRTMLGNNGGLPSGRSVRAEMPTPTEEELQELMNSSETIRPPEGSGLSVLIAMTAIAIPPSPPSKVNFEDSGLISRSTMTTLHGNEDAEQSNDISVRAEGLAGTEKSTEKMGMDSEVKVVDSSPETVKSDTGMPDEHDEFYERQTLVAIPPERLILQSKIPDERPPEESRPREATQKSPIYGIGGGSVDFNETEIEWFEEAPKPEYEE